MSDKITCLRFRRDQHTQWVAEPTRSVDSRFVQSAIDLQNKGSLDRCWDVGWHQWEEDVGGASVRYWATREGESVVVMASSAGDAPFGSVQDRAGDDWVQKALEASPDIFLLIQVDGRRIIAANQAAAEALDSLDQLLTRDAADFFPQMTRSQFQGMVETACGGETPHGEARTLIMRRDGSVFAAEIRLRALCGADEGLAIMVARDVTQVLRVECELKRAKREIELVGAVGKAIVSASSEIDLLERVCSSLRTKGGFAAAYVRRDCEAQHPRYFSELGEPPLLAALEGLGYEGKDADDILHVRDEIKIFSGRARLERHEGRLPRWVLPTFTAATAVPLLREGKTLGSMFLFSTTDANALEEILSCLQEVANDVAFGLTVQRKEIERRKADQLLVQKLRIERAVAQYCSDLLVGEDYTQCLSRGTRAMLEAVGADQIFLFEAQDIAPGSDLARRVCEEVREGAERRVRTPDWVQLDMELSDEDRNSAGRWQRHLQLDLLPTDQLLVYPLSSGRRYFGIVGYLFFNGSDRCGEVTAATLRLIAKLMSELHERSRADKKLKLLATAIDGTDEGVLIVEAAQAFEGSPIMLANEGACRMSGYSRDELLGRAFGALVAEGGVVILEREERSAKGLPTRGKTNFRHRQGHNYLVEYAVYPIRGEKQEVVQYLCICRDITERQKLETRLAFANKMESVGQLSAGIAHEINTPSQFIGDNLRFLQDAWERIGPLLKDLPVEIDGADGKQSRRLRRILEAIPDAIGDACEGVARIASIVKAMRDFSHPEKRFAQVDLNHCISTTVTVARNEWKYVADLTLDLADDLPKVEILPGDINQVLLNLIVNAAHAIGEKLGEAGGIGEIRISSRLNGGFAEVAVSDTGGGIPESIRENIFDPFFTTKEVGRGTGQGLFMAHSIIEQRHGGRLWFESEVGVGTTFYFEIPVERKGNLIDGEN